MSRDVRWFVIAVIAGAGGGVLGGTLNYLYGYVGTVVAIPLSFLLGIVIADACEPWCQSGRK